jgi:hypothetical protein
MSGITQDRTRTFKATADLSTSQFCFVKLDTSNQNQVVIAAAATDQIIGVLQNAPKAGDVAQVLLLNGNGTTLVQAAGAISIGAVVTSNASGLAVATTTTGNLVCGVAIDAAAASGDLIEVALLNYKY